ncbi:MAG: multicopper oxidase domain-containing protein [Nitrospinaceae bacterium]
MTEPKMDAMGHGDLKISDHPGHPMAIGKPMEMARPVRIEEGKIYSPPPPLMGKQMGTVETLNVPPLGYELDGKVKVFRLIAQPMENVFTDGNLMDQSIIPAMNRFTGGMGNMLNLKQKGIVWGYNGSMPGPTIEATEGETIRIILKNELPEPTSIHWHGLEVPNKQDGSGGVTEGVTLPGETHVYEFTLYQSGTFMYHTGFNVMKQDGLGLGGLVVIHPREEKNKPDREFAIMLQEWTFQPGNPNPNLTSMAFNWFTFNGKSAPNIDIMKINQGERVRIRLGNLSMQSHPIHIHGYTWNVVGTEGGPIPEAAQLPGATVNVAPGTTRDVEFVAWNPGVWRFHCHKLHHIMNAMADRPMGIMPHGGMFTLIHVEPMDSKVKWSHSKRLEEKP